VNASASASRSVPRGAGVTVTTAGGTTTKPIAIPG
jgi:hypothetical protein